MKLTTKDQRFFSPDGKRIKAEIDVYLTQERIEGEPNPPSIEECRHAVLEIKNNSGSKAYVIYDRLLCRIVNGVYYMLLAEVLECAQHYNEDPDAPQDMAPSGRALCLKYPKVDTSKSVPIVVEVETNEE